MFVHGSKSKAICFYHWQVPHDQKNALREQLLAAAPYLTKSFETESYYRVHWTKVSDLVEKRRVFLEKGMAYVPVSQQISLVLAEFSRRLDAALEVSKLHRVQLVKGLHCITTKPGYSTCVAQT